MYWTTLANSPRPVASIILLTSLSDDEPRNEAVRTKNTKLPACSKAVLKVGVWDRKMCERTRYPQRIASGRRTPILSSFDMPEATVPLERMRSRNAR